MDIHLFNCFTCHARVRNLKTGMTCLVIDTNDGLVLVDTGLGLSDYSKPTWFTQSFRVITFMPFDLNEAAANQIQILGHKLEDVKHIVLTHMHFDHCSGLSDFPHAKSTHIGSNTKPSPKGKFANLQSSLISRVT